MNVTDSEDEDQNFFVSHFACSVQRGRGDSIEFEKHIDGSEQEIEKRCKRKPCNEEAGGTSIDYVMLTQVRAASRSWSCHITTRFRYPFFVSIALKSS